MIRKVILVGILFVALIVSASIVVQTKSTDGTAQVTNTTAAERQAIIKGIQDYIQGKTDKLPASTTNTNTSVVPADYPTPWINATYLDLKFNNTMSTTSYPSVYVQNDPVYQMNRAMVGGSPNYGTALAIDCFVNGFYSLESSTNDQFVVHQDGDSQYSGAVGESAIQIMRNGDIIKVVFWIDNSPHSPYDPEAYVYPAGDSFYLFIRPHVINGNGNYDSVEFCIFDLTTLQSNSVVWQLNPGVIGHANTVDVAEEWKYPNFNPTVHWNHVDQMHAYNVDWSMINIQQNGMHIYQLDNTYNGQVIVKNQCYVDFYDARTASVWLTRYDPSNSPPLHP